MNISEKIVKIKKIPFFGELGEEELKIIAQKIFVKKYLPQEILIYQNDTSSGVYFILKGSARIYRITEDGEEINLGLCGENEIVGEMSLIDDFPRSANVEALQELETLILTGEDFKAIINNHPKIAVSLLKVLSKKIRQNNEHIEEVLSKNLIDRTFKMLQVLAQFYQNGDILLSQEELSSIIGATRSRVTEVLNILESEGKVNLSHKKIHVNKIVS